VRLREQGLRPVQLWVPDVRAAGFTEEAHREAHAVAVADRRNNDMSFVEDITAGWDE
jgi:hypothetical protein